jgi:hypothetical protein
MRVLTCRFAARASAVAAALALSARAADVSGAPPAHIEQARDAFDQGAAAHARGDFGKASGYFARADELVPSDEALEAAIDSATRADDAVLAMRLVDRSARSTSTQQGLADARKAAEERFRRRTGRVLIECECSPTLDGRPIAAGVPTWALAGSHDVLAMRGDVRAAAKVVVEPDRIAEVKLAFEPVTSPASPARAIDARTDPADRAPPVHTPRSGLSPTWFWIGAGATALLGGAAALSGVDTLSRRDDFERAGCPAQGSAGCDRISSDGRSAQLRTNLLIGGAAAAALGSVVLATVLVDWRARPRSPTATTFMVGPNGVALAGTLP